MSTSIYIWTSLHRAGLTVRISPMALRFGLLLGLLVLTPRPISAAYDDGAAAMMRGEYVTALSELRPAAEQGDARAQVLLGSMYRQGQGVPKDPTLAAHWYTKAADQKYAPAQIALGHLYRLGVGVPQSHTEASRWYRKAAEQNVTSAQVSLGAAYFYGQGLEQDYVQAHLWFSLALAGISIRDADLALAKKGIAMAEAKMSLEQIEEARRLARSWNPAPPQQ